MGARMIVEEFRSLNVEGRLELLRTLWAEVSADVGGRALTEEEVDFLDERLRQVESDPRPDRRWDALRGDLLAPR